MGANISSGIINFGSLLPNELFSLLVAPDIFPKKEKKEPTTCNFQRSCIYRAQKRAAWRQARLKSLEQDALQAQMMIQNLNTSDDLTDPRRRNKDALDGVEEEEVRNLVVQTSYA